MQVIGKALGFDPVGDAIAAERSGYDGVRVIDHFFSGLAPEPPHPVPHALAGLGAAAVATSRVLLTQTMLAATMHHPAECAQAVATIDRISAGRAGLGLGAGWFAPEHAAMGLALGSPRDRVDRLVEAASICRAMFEQRGAVTFEGRFFRAVSDVEWDPTPHVPEVMVGAASPRLMSLAAAVANRLDILEIMRDGRAVLDDDHVNDVEHLGRRVDLVHRAAADAGNEVRLSATLNLTLAATVAERERLRREYAPVAWSSPALLDRELLRAIDTADGLLERLATLAELGIDRVHIRPKDVATHEWLDDALPKIQALA
jgi:alkanesulfonate monooxygenase SsuD/methylene tetrahydromethanopterin reductase-like flavin-dependent oxidoreductase (luciferase family)